MVAAAHWSVPTYDWLRTVQYTSKGPLPPSARAANERAATACALSDSRGHEGETSRGSTPHTYCSRGSRLTTIRPAL